MPRLRTLSTSVIALLVVGHFVRPHSGLGRLVNNAKFFVLVDETGCAGRTETDSASLFAAYGAAAAATTAATTTKANTASAKTATGASATAATTTATGE